MGAFVLLQRATDRADEAQIARMIAAGARQGFASPRRLETALWTVLLFPKFNGQAPLVHAEDEENFIAATGTLVHGKATGAAALAAIAADIAANRCPLDTLYGSFCLIVCRAGAIFLLPDRLQVYKIYRNAAGTVLSSSFLAVLESVAQPRANRQAVYEYVFQGATYDGRTVIDQVRLATPGPTPLEPPQRGSSGLLPLLHAGPGWTGAARHVAMTIAALRGEFGALAAQFGSNIETALSGGYDSRLILALLRDRGLRPRVHVYGRDDDADVAIAKTIAAGEGFPIEHTDKSSCPLPRLDAFSETVAQNFAALDGYPSDGIFDGGADVTTRRARAAGGALALNGGGGEIFRNFFYLPDRAFTVQQVLWSFFCQFDPAVTTAAFDETAYLDGLARAVLRLIDRPAGPGGALATRLARTEIEFLYPCLRCAYWMGRNNSVNNRFGFAATPFIEPALVGLALQIPIAAKNHGRFEAALIAAIDPALARYPSVYGQGFDEAPALARRLKGGMTLARPPRLRKWSYRLQNRMRRAGFSGVLGPDYLSRVIDPDCPALRRYFRIERVRSALEFNRICTLEYLFERHAVTGDA